MAVGAFITNFELIAKSKLLVHFSVKFLAKFKSLLWVDGPRTRALGLRVQPTPLIKYAGEQLHPKDAHHDHKEAEKDKSIKHIRYAPNNDLNQAAHALHSFDGSKGFDYPEYPEGLE